MPADRRAPAVFHAEREYRIMLHLIGAAPIQRLGARVGIVARLRDDIVRAFDLLITGSRNATRPTLRRALCQPVANLQAFASRIFSAAALSKATPFASSNWSNSPDSVISVTMSQPPTNSPLT